MNQSALSLIEKCAKDRVLFVGETVTDVYQYCHPLARPPKDLILAVQERGRESFEGGIRAAAKHAESFCSRVEIWSDWEIRITRLVEQVYFRKLIQSNTVPVKTGDHQPYGIDEYDCLCVIDYGLGMMGPENIREVSDEASYLAVNVQTNANNTGFNLATKYERCDYLVVDENEARLATQNQWGPIEDSVTALAKISPKVIVTLGRYGCVGFENGSLVKSPSLIAERIIDTTGAGDAFFAITAPMSRYAENIKDLMEIGNAAGALKAQVVGHRKSVTKTELIECLKAH